MKYKSVYKSVSELIGAFSILIAGLLFVLITDVKLKISSNWLFVSIILSFVSGIFFFVANVNKEKLSFFFTFKGVSTAFSFGYMAFLFVYKASEAFPKTQALGRIGNLTFVLCLIFTIIAIIAQLINIILNILHQEDLGLIGPNKKENG